MAYMTNTQFRVMGKVWTELKENNGKLSVETFEEYSKLMREIQSDKDRQKEKTRNYISERRKTDKNYARKKKEEK